MPELDNFLKLLYALIITIFYRASIQAIYFDKLLQMSQKGNYTLGLIVVEISYIIGPLGLIFMNYLSSKLFYRVLFFIGSFTSTLYVIFYTLIIKELVEQSQKIILIIITLVEAPFSSIFFCTFNFYVNSLCPKQTKGAYFGVAYSLFCTSALFSALYLNIAEDQTGDEESSNIFYIALIMTTLTTILYWLITENKVTNQDKSLMPIEKYYDPKYAQQELIQSRSKHQQEYSQYFIINEFHKIFNSIKIHQIGLVLPSIFTLSLIYAFDMSLSSVLVIYVTNSTIQDSNNISTNNTLIQCYLYFGMGQFLGGIVSGLIGDFINRFTTLIGVTFICAFTFLIGFTVLSSKQIILMFTFMFFLGFSISSQCTALFSFFASYCTQQTLTMSIWLLSIGIGINTLLFSIPYIQDISLTNSLYYLFSYSLICVLGNLVCLFLYMMKSRKYKKDFDVEMR